MELLLAERLLVGAIGKAVMLKSSDGVVTRQGDKLPSCKVSPKALKTGCFAANEI